MSANAILFKMLTGQYVNQYHLQELLGAGGFGGVYRVAVVVRNQVIATRALKLIVSDGTDRQLRELQAGINLSHDHVLKCTPLGNAR